MSKLHEVSSLVWMWCNRSYGQCRCGAVGHTASVGVAQ